MGDRFYSQQRSKSRSSTRRSNIEISGIEELSVRLQKIPQSIRVKGFRQATAAVGKAVSQDLKAIVPIRSGKLRQSISYRFLRKRGNEVAALKIGGVRKVSRGAKPQAQDYVLRFLEKGAKRHMLKAWTHEGRRYGTAAVRKMNSAGLIVPRRILHPGIKASFQLERLATRNQARYSEVFAQTVTQRVLAEGGL